MKYEPNNIISLSNGAASSNDSTRSQLMNAQAGGPRKPASSMPWTVVIGECS